MSGKINYPNEVILPGDGGKLVLIEVVMESVKTVWGGSLTKSRQYAKYYWSPTKDDNDE